MLQKLWKASPALTTTGLLMIPVLAGAAIGLAADPRIIAGAPAWLKPAKFAASIAIYTFTLAWIFTTIPEWTRTRRVAGWATAATLLLEMIAIVVQVFRGTTSHFNVGTAFDTAVFATMGLAIIVQALSAVAVAVALWRHAFDDRALGWALRLGLALSIIGAMTGGVMTRPTEEQLHAAAAAGRMTVSGAHTVGAQDGGRGLPGTGWSIEHGDLRVAHFVGLHAMQALPLVALLLAWRGVSDRVRIRLTITAAASHLALFAILLAQALRGQPLLAPDGVTSAILGLWMLGTALGAGVSAYRLPPARRPVAVQREA